MKFPAFQVAEVEAARATSFKELKALARDFEELTKEKEVALKEFEVQKRGMQRILDDTQAHVESLTKRGEELVSNNTKLAKEVGA